MTNLVLRLRKGYRLLKERLYDAPATKVFRAYWKLYGGISSLLKSPYLYMSFLVTSLCYPLWNSEPNPDDFARPWSQLAVDIVPSMLGFSMGGMAIMLAFSGAKFFEYIAQRGKPDSYYLRIISNFFHFILMQTFALLLALASKAFPNDVMSGIGFFFLVYAIFTGVAIAGQLLMTAFIYNAGASLSEQQVVKSNERSSKKIRPTPDGNGD